MANTVVNKCRPTDVESNAWCLKDLFALGEGTDLIAIPTPTWNATRDRWFVTNNAASGTPEVKILVPKAGANLMQYIYNAPTGSTPGDTLFPSPTPASENSLYFPGNALLFSPTVGNGIEANGVPYQSSTFKLPVGSSMDYDALIQYLQSKAWTFLKVNHDQSRIHVYGGPRGYFPVADEIAEMLYSGNNDTKGETQVSFVVDKAPYVIEYLEVPAGTAAGSAMSDLMGYIKAAICKPNGIVVEAAA